MIITQLSQITGRCHAHLTIEHNNLAFKCPKGWKVTIIVLSNKDRTQKDIIITKHFKIGSAKAPSGEYVLNEMYATANDLEEKGLKVVRLKLEHEELPTFEPSVNTYRECHIKIKLPRSLDIVSIPGFVPSHNVLEDVDIQKVAFLSARYYTGALKDVDFAIDSAAETIKQLNPEAVITSVRKETILHDSNLELDKWWA